VKAGKMNRGGSVVGGSVHTGGNEEQLMQRTRTLVGIGLFSLGTILISQPAVAQDEAEEPRLLRQAIDDAGAGGGLESSGIDIGGHAQGSWTYNFDDPDSDENAFRAFDFEHNEGVFNQLMLYVDRPTDASVPWDLGGRIEMLFGADARFTPSNGLFDFDDDEEDDDTEFDITQVYAEVVLPVGNGIKTKIGKFITPLGFELVDPTGNTFYSHNYLFNLVPFSHTGVFMTYDFNDQWTVGGGVSRGWDQTCQDNNDAIDGLGLVTWNAAEATSMTLSFTIGPEQEDNTDDYRYAFNYYITHDIGDQLSLAGEATFISEENNSEDGDTSQVFGITGYATYALSEYMDLGGRAEWLNDTDRLDGADANLYEVTVGLQIHPMPNHGIGKNLLIRPEIRYDFADEDVFDDGDEDTQLTFGVDAIFTF
jgi:Putative beta-barrel porin-2, OmpL-like. bbp2